MSSRAEDSKGWKVKNGLRRAAGRAVKREERLGGRNGYDVELWLHPDIVQMPMTKGQNANNF